MKTIVLAATLAAATFSAPASAGESVACLTKQATKLALASRAVGQDLCEAKIAWQEYFMTFGHESCPKSE